MHKDLSRKSIFIIKALAWALMLFALVGAGFWLGRTEAQADNQTGFAGGSGTAHDPFLIATAEQLDNVRNYLLALGLSGEVVGGYNFKLISDIDLTDFLERAGNDDGKGWMPLGGSSISFIGNFDGNGHTISGLWINRPSQKYVGLFGYTFDSGIKNLSLRLSERGITGLSYCGGIAGHFSTISKVKAAASISNCSVVGDVTAVLAHDDITPISSPAAYAGLIAGNISYARARGCYASGSVSGLSSIGGIAGVLEGGDILDCLFEGSVIPSAPSDWQVACAGGIVGSGFGDSVIKCCFYFGTAQSDARVAAIAGFNGKISGFDYAATPVTPPALYNCFYNLDVFYNPTDFIALDETETKGLVVENCKGLKDSQINKANLTGFDFNIWGFDKQGKLLLRSFGSAYDAPPASDRSLLYMTLGCSLFAIATISAALILYHRKKTVTKIVEKKVFIEVPFFKKTLPDDLSDQERRVAMQLLRGRSLKEIADEFDLTKNTVQTYMKRVYTKAGVSGQKEFIAHFTASD